MGTREELKGEVQDDDIITLSFSISTSKYAANSFISIFMCDKGWSGSWRKSNLPPSYCIWSNNLELCLEKVRVKKCSEEKVKEKGERGNDLEEREKEETVGRRRKSGEKNETKKYLKSPSN